MFKYCVEDTETNKIQSPPSKTLRGGGGGGVRRMKGGGDKQCRGNICLITNSPENKLWFFSISQSPWCKYLQNGQSQATNLWSLLTKFLKFIIQFSQANMSQI